jgi:hypothetical protein
VQEIIVRLVFRTIAKLLLYSLTEMNSEHLLVNNSPFLFISMTISHKEKADALLTLLQIHFSEDYMGTDDDMSDRFDSWVSNLTDKEVADICISVYREGI